MDATEKLADALIKNKKKLIKLKEKGYPLQYIIGNVNFYGYQILVNKHVLIPRFETEQLLEKTINYIKQIKLMNPDILDIGTGSGCIAITLAKEINPKSIDAIDINKKALKLAKKNADLNNVSINFINKNIIKFNTCKKYNLIISNPPYLTKNDIVDSKIKYEPQQALYAKDNGLYFYKYIIKEFKNNLTKKSILAFEIGINQGNYLKNYAQKYYPKATILVENDLTNRNRFLFIINE